nr:uncharacterized protein LOC109174985 [Ipomoea trifida]
MQDRRSLKATLLPLDDNIDRKKKNTLPSEKPSFDPKETTTTIDALPQSPQPNPQPNHRLMKDFGRPQLPSFHGSTSEDALTFIRDFYGIVQHFPLNNLTEDALRMRYFPYTLRDAAKTWFMTLTPGSLRTWSEVYNKFIVGNSKKEKAMLDLGESINLMPYSVYLQLGLDRLKPTTMSLELADLAVRYPSGMSRQCFPFCFRHK